MIFVQGYGIVAYGGAGGTGAPAPLEEAASGAGPAYWSYFETLLASVRDVTPVIVVILVFYLLVLRIPITDFVKRAAGFGLVILGLYLFVLGLKLGLFPIGESLAIELAGSGNLWLIYSFAFAVGFATTVAEPALTAVAGKAEEVSEGSIRQSLLRGFVALGVGVGILLGTYRIIHGDSIVYYILVGYIVVIIMTFFAPRTIIPIAYDSGGVTTSTITVPIVAALGLGLATSIEGRDPLIDGFGLIAFASLFPMIAVLAYGISKREAIRFHERRLLRMEQQAMTSMSQHLDADLDGDGIDDNIYIESLPADKKQIITITGQSGAGVTTVTHQLADLLGYRRFSAGGLFRTLAAQYDMSVEKLNDYAHSHRVIDREIDTLIQRLGKGNELVLDARLGFFWIHDSFKVYLQADPEVAARRIYKATMAGHRKSEQALTIIEVTENIRNLTESTQARYFREYGIDISNTNRFDLVLDTNNMSTDEVVALIRQQYRTWQNK